MSKDNIVYLFLMSQINSLGGAERQQFELAEHLADRGYTVYLAYLYSCASDPFTKAEKRLRSKGVRLVQCLKLNVHPSPLRLLIIAWQLRQLVIRYKVSILETSSSTPSLLAAIATLGTSCRHLCGIHYVFCHDDINLKVFIWKSLLSLSYQTSFYAVSNYAKNAWIEFSGVSDERCIVIYNSIDPLLLSSNSINKHNGDIRSELGLSSSTNILLYVGRLAKYKRFDFLIDCVNKLMNDHDIVLLIAGELDPSVSGSTALLEDVQARIVDSSLASRFRFLGKRTDIAAIMQSATLLLHPSSKESFGLVLIESLALGLPLVAFGVEAIPEILEGSDSIIVEPNDYCKFISSVDSALSTPALYSDSSRKARLLFASKYSIERRASSFLARASRLHTKSKILHAC